MDFKNKVALVTGAARGIGFATARRFAQAGASVALVVHRPSSIEETRQKLAAQGLEGEVYACDVTKAEELHGLLSAIVERQGHPDVLFNNAAAYQSTSFFEMTEAEFSHVIQTNLTAVFLISQIVAKDMVARGQGGAIVNMSSVSVRMASPMAIAYAAAKGGVSSLTAGMALALAPHGIRANAIAPATILTGLTQKMYDSPDLRRMVLSRTPIGRFGAPADIAGVVLFLASEDAAFITGETIYVDGGRSALSFTLPVSEAAMAAPPPEE